MYDYVKTVGKNINAIRTGKNMSQEKLANLCGHNTESARSWISKIEKGQRNIGTDELGKIAYALNVTPNTLFIEIECKDTESLYNRLMAYNDEFQKIINDKKE